jgi:hypothetical protein
MSLGFRRRSGLADRAVRHGFDGACSARSHCHSYIRVESSAAGGNAILAGPDPLR